jgi:large subunit ribosomal protein L30
MANRLRIRQTRSAIRREERQKRTIRALGIRRLHQVVEVDDTPQIRGMIAKVSHLVEVEEIEG